MDDSLSDSSDFFRAYRKALTRHLAEHALRTDGPFRLASGGMSDWYIDGRKTTFDGQGSVLVGRCILEILHPMATAVGGLTMGADPVAMATVVLGGVDDRKLKAFSIRKEPKQHGTGGRLVGPLDNTDRAVIVEDTTTTGRSFREAIDVLRAEHVGVIQAISVFDRSDGVVAAMMVEEGLPFLALVTPDDLGLS